MLRGDDETQDPDADDEGYHNVATGKKRRFRSLKVHIHSSIVVIVKESSCKKRDKMQE